VFVSAFIVADTVEGWGAGNVCALLGFGASLKIEWINPKVIKITAPANIFAPVLGLLIVFCFTQI